jgi:hypothetical protein
MLRAITVVGKLMKTESWLGSGDEKTFKTHETNYN